MKKLITCLLFSIASFANAQIATVPIPGSPLTLSIQANPQPLQYLNTNPAATLHTLWDDGWKDIPLPFNFPFYGQTFNQSTMYSNGAVQFGRPVGNEWPSWNNTFCCSGIELNSGTPSGYNYSILPLQTDIAGWEGNNHYTLGTSNTMTYGWYNVSQYGNSANKSTFELKIDSTGGIDMKWAGALVTYSPVTIGTIGNASLGEFTKNYHNPSGINIPSLTQLSTGIDYCVANPLYSPTCPGYAQAYFNQQCTISALYNPSCPGYQQAYFNQQCTVNPLYNSACPGYAEAYFSQQCSLDGLYSTSCPNYAEAYAKKNILNITTSPSSTPTSVSSTVSTTVPTTSISSDGTVSTAVSTTGDTNVDRAITTTTTTTNSAAAPAAPVQLTQPSGAQQNANTQASTQTQSSSQKTETKTSSSTTDRQQPQQSAKSESKGDDKQKSSEMKQAANEKAKQEMKRAETATSFEGQVAVQSNVIGAMSFVPGFSTYAQVNVPDVLARDLQRQYGKPVVDNRNAGRRLFGASDKLHEEMVNDQYRK